MRVIIVVCLSVIVECVPRLGLLWVLCFFVFFLWLWIVGGVGDVEACVMLSDAFLEDNVSGYSLVFPM